MSVPGSCWSHGDDEELLTLQGRNDGGLVIVVNVGNLDAFGNFVGAVCPSKGCDSVFAGFEEFGDDVQSDSTSGLEACVSVAVYGIGNCLTYSDNGDSLDGVLEAGGLVFRVLGHFLLLATRTLSLFEKYNNERVVFE